MRRPLLSSVLSIALAALLLLGTGEPHAHPGAPAGWDILGAARALAQSVGFLATFDGQPTAPQTWHPTDWDMQVNIADSYRGDGTSMPLMQAHHGPDCGAPPATHPITRLEDAVFVCKDHMMTSITGGYGQIVLTPNAMVDFTDGEAVVTFDMSTFR